MHPIHRPSIKNKKNGNLIGTINLQKSKKIRILKWIKVWICLYCLCCLCYSIACTSEEEALKALLEKESKDPSVPVYKEIKIMLLADAKPSLLYLNNQYTQILIIQLIERYDDYALLKHLIEDEFPVFRTDYGIELIKRIIRKNDLDILEYLIETGMDTSQLNNSEVFTAFITGNVKNPNPQNYEMLWNFLDKSESAALQINDNKPVHKAISQLYEEYADCSLLLYFLGEDSDTAASLPGLEFLSTAVRNNNTGMLECLIQAGIDINATYDLYDRGYKTDALSEALHLTHYECADLLVQAGAGRNNKKTFQDLLASALRKAETQKVRWLVENGAKLSHNLVVGILIAILDHYTQVEQEIHPLPDKERVRLLTIMELLNSLGYVFLEDYADNYEYSEFYFACTRMLDVTRTEDPRWCAKIAKFLPLR